jgi:hypothetical protein
LVTWTRLKKPGMMGISWWRGMNSRVAHLVSWSRT